mmetsp:Transcript_61857/g.102715  ORF Transcript_61857/g.102715 Transcript_61857/m.102715 type:complete len:253 (-) Transcript_61857:247-1005(-)
MSSPSSQTQTAPWRMTSCHTRGRDQLRTTTRILRTKTQSRRMRPTQKTPTARAVHRHCSSVRGRYSKAVEGPKDKLTWHTGLLMEWSHGLFTTVFELAWYNGLSGYAGKSNWVRDKESRPTALYTAMPDGMKAPWREDLCELRATDHPAHSVEEFSAYLDEYTGTRPTDRFLDPSIVSSHDVCLSLRGLADVMQYMINYAGADRSYHEESRNCQTFSADFLGFLIGQKKVEPYHPLMRVLYKPRHHQFLYDC